MRGREKNARAPLRIADDVAERNSAFGISSPEDPFFFFFFFFFPGPPSPSSHCVPSHRGDARRDTAETVLPAREEEVRRSRSDARDLAESFSSPDDGYAAAVVRYLSIRVEGGGRRGDKLRVGRGIPSSSPPSHALRLCVIGADWRTRAC